VQPAQEDLMKMMDNKRLRVMTGIMVVLAVILGPGQASAKTEIHFWHAMSGNLNDTVEALARRFNDRQNDYEVKPVRKGTYPETLLAAITAGQSKTPPHIVQIFDVGTQTMLQSGLILPIAPLMRDQGIAIDWNDFIQPVRSYYSKDHRLYSMPFNSSTPILYYNKDAFQKAGLSSDTPPTTWREVGGYSRRLLATGAAKCGFSTGWPSWILFENMAAWHDLPFATHQNGFGGLDTQLLINSEFQIKFISQLVTWQAENIYSYGGRMDMADQKFVSGECAMYLQSSALIGDIMRSIHFRWGTAQLPHWGERYKRGTSIPGGATLWIMKGLPAADYKGVAQFLKFLAEPEQQAWWHQSTGYITITNASLKYLAYTNHFLRSPDQWTAFAQLTSGNNTPNTQGIRLGNFVAVRDAIEDELEDILGGKKGVKQGLDDAVARGNAILKEYADLYR
jgi:sn-glycerol 3-phosphate transport system substrate-binding protein